MTTTTPANARSRKNKKRPLHPTGRLIKQLRKASGYTQEEIKNILGFQATSAISKIESRDFIPDLLRLQKMLALLSPSPEQRHEILDYYGYDESELPEKHAFVSGLKGKAEKGDILSALHTLFYLFVYDRDYTGLIETAQTLYNQSFYIPQSVRSCAREVEMVVGEILSCRRLLAQGMLSRQNLAFEEALQRAEMAQQLLTLIQDRFSKKLNADAQLFLLQVKLHICFCFENTHFGMLRLRSSLQTGGGDELHPESIEGRGLTGIRGVIAEIERDFPEYNLQEVRQMTLFVERETLHLLAAQCDDSDHLILAQLLEQLGGSGDAEGVLANHWLPVLKGKAADETFKQVYQGLYKSQSRQEAVWTPTLNRYRQILLAHQQVSNWDGSTAHAAIVSTFLNYPVLLARLGHFSWAQDIFNLLYLQLTVAETHYRWTANLAICKGLEYISQTQLNSRKIPEKDLPGVTELLEELSRLLLKAVADLRHVKSLNSPRYMRYLFLEEPVIYFVLLHARRQPQFKDLPALQPVFKTFEEMLSGGPL
ncbi:MAG: helix-turn-helix domain-containing protein [Candidatus Sericytochromatia bacterium]